MRKLYKHTILLMSILVYAYFIGVYVVWLLQIAFIVVLLPEKSPKTLSCIPIILILAGYVGLRYLPDTQLSLPLGYSVFAFTAISYIVDCLWKRHEKHLYIDVLCYLFFFPKMLAGPIVRYDNFENQLNSGNNIKSLKLYEAFKLATFAAFCKFVLADRFAEIVNIEQYQGINAWMVSVLFAIQLYLDFYAYSLFAIAFGLVCGIRLPESFRNPYGAKTFKQFWNRWNITLSDWLRDYVYIPLGGSRNKNQLATYRNVMITFVISGLWHGLSVPFVLWGVLHGILVILEKFAKTIIVRRNRMISWIYNCLMLFVVIMLWQLFRLEDVYEIGEFCVALFSPTGVETTVFFYMMAAIGSVLILDSKNTRRLLYDISDEKHFVYREVALFSAMLVVVILFYDNPSINFFYFRF